MIEDGEDFIMPNIGAHVDIELIGKYKGQEFYNRKLSYNVGEGNTSPHVSTVFVKYSLLILVKKIFCFF